MSKILLCFVKIVDIVILQLFSHQTKLDSHIFVKYSIDRILNCSEYMFYDWFFFKDNTGSFYQLLRVFRILFVACMQLGYLL